MTTVTRLVELGMVPIVANEVIAQFTAGVGSPTALMEKSVPTRLAIELAAQAAGAKDARRLFECGMAPDLAKEVVS